MVYDQFKKLLSRKKESNSKPFVLRYKSRRTLSQVNMALPKNIQIFHFPRVFNLWQVIQEKKRMQCRRNTLICKHQPQLLCIAHTFVTLKLNATFAKKKIKTAKERQLNTVNMNTFSVGFIEYKCGDQSSSALIWSCMG